ATLGYSDTTSTREAAQDNLDSVSLTFTTSRSGGGKLYTDNRNGLGNTFTSQGQMMPSDYRLTDQGSTTFNSGYADDETTSGTDAEVFTDQQPTAYSMLEVANSSAGSYTVYK